MPSGSSAMCRTAPGASRPHSRSFIGDPTEGVPLLRIHSQCFTGEMFGSLRCDCDDQLDIAMREIAEEGRGLVILPRSKSFTPAAPCREQRNVRRSL